VRPLKLEVKGFTAFRDPAAIDFTDLDVFAIAGPTGSGKSSLLDAMTYALYGRVERVGDRVSQLISQGQPRMAVTLEFAVGHDRYRVTRSTAAKGATKILLERRDGGGEWKQAGEGADRVREAEHLIARAIGLTYDGFTRSVLLPQGKFAEFLVGDPKKRRDILTELLGLSLFRRMAERAGAIAKESGLRSQERALSIEREYADAAPEALKEAKSAAREAQKREKALTAAAETVLEVLARWKEAAGSVEELRACAAEVTTAAQGVEAVAEELPALAKLLEDAAGEVGERAAMEKAAEKSKTDAASAYRKAEASIGAAADLTAARGRAQTLADATEARMAKQHQLDAWAEASGPLGETLKAAEAQVKERSEGLAEAEAEAGRAEAALEEARHADRVAAVAAGLRVGDPCPVCGVPLERLPKRTAAGGLDRAAKTLERARRAAETGREALRVADRARDAAAHDLEAAAADRRRLTGELADLDTRIAADQGSLTRTLGAPLPELPVAAIDDRLAELQRLDREERAATREAAEAANALLKAEGRRDQAAGRVQRLGDRLGVDHRPLAQRAARAMGKPAARVRLPVAPAADDAAALERHSRALAEALNELAGTLAAEIEGRSSIEGHLLAEANAKVKGLVEPAGDLESLARTVNDECRNATAEVATSEQRAAYLARRVERRRQLAEEVKELEARAIVFRKLANELRADHLIAFLQAEALQLLAAAGSERLASLSDGRYRIVCREDEFFVIDTWNGDDERSVRTLSGGETFLASLALALALADQVRSLSVTDRARLDSLFLDEGFGTLDQETLGVVVDAIEQLAGDGRLVGVITHVRDLAEQFPRIEVEKSPRGSSARYVA
jgi:DNA repair protein SbcC/Rad50